MASTHIIRVWKRIEQHRREAVSEITQTLRDMVVDISWKMGVSYHLKPEDREDLVAAALYQLSIIDWRLKLPEIRAGGTAFTTYAHVVVLNTMRKELRRILSMGFRGLDTKGSKLADLPMAKDMESTTPEPQEEEEGSEMGSNWELPAHSNGTADRAAANQLCEIAEEELLPAEWRVIRLLYGFDGGEERTPVQIGRELNLPRKEVSSLIESGLARLRTCIT